MMSETDRERLRRAKAYPYPAPPYSYLLVNGAVCEIVEAGGDPLRDGLLRVDGRTVSAAEVLDGIGDVAALEARVPVIAHGSNAAPETLARKYTDNGENEVIPVIKARLAGHDVVYATHFSSYGSIPSTLTRAPGAVAEVAVNFLTPRQLARMHETELSALNYVHGRLGGVEIALDGLGTIDAADVYVTRHGSLGVSGAPLALAALVARGRCFAAATKIEVLSLVRDHLAPGRDLDAFILETIADAELRRARSEALRGCACPPELPGFEPIGGAPDRQP